MKKSLAPYIIIIDMFWLTIFLINWLLNILAMEFGAIRKIKAIKKRDKELEEKYKAFCRPDVAWFNRPWLYLCCHLILIKLVVAFSFLILC